MLLFKRVYKGVERSPKLCHHINIITQSQGLQRLSSLVLTCMGIPIPFLVGRETQALFLHAGSQNDAHTLILPPGFE